MDEKRTIVWNFELVIKVFRAFAFSILFFAGSRTFCATLERSLIILEGQQLSAALSRYVTSVSSVCLIPKSPFEVHMAALHFEHKLVKRKARGTILPHTVSFSLFRSPTRTFMCCTLSTVSDESASLSLNVNLRY